MHVNTIRKEKRTGFIYRLIYRIFHQTDIDEVIFKSQNLSERQELLNKLIQEEMTKACIIKEEIPTHIEDFVNFSIQHIYSDMQVFKKSLKYIKSLPYIKDVKYSNDLAHYNLIANKDNEWAYICIDDYKITLTTAANSLFENKAIEILSLCVDEITKVQCNTTNKTSI